MAAQRHTASAENDLLEAWLFIAEDNPPAADRVVDVIDREARHLPAHPSIGRDAPGACARVAKLAHHDRYVLFYFADTAGVVIARSGAPLARPMLRESVERAKPGPARAQNL